MFQEEHGLEGAVKRKASSTNIPSFTPMAVPYEPSFQPPSFGGHSHFMPTMAGYYTGPPPAFVPMTIPSPFVSAIGAPGHAHGYPPCWAPSYQQPAFATVPYVNVPTQAPDPGVFREGSVESSDTTLLDPTSAPADPGASIPPITYLMQELRLLVEQTAQAGGAPEPNDSLAQQQVAAPLPKMLRGHTLEPPTNGRNSAEVCKALDVPKTYSNTRPRPSSPTQPRQKPPRARPPPNKTAARRIYTCPTCTATFFSFQHLSRHRHIHDTVKPYACDGGCEKRFARSDNMKIHRKRVHGL